MRFFFFVADGCFGRASRLKSFLICALRCVDNIKGFHVYFLLVFSFTTHLASSNLSSLGHAHTLPWRTRPLICVLCCVKSAPEEFRLAIGVLALKPYRVASQAPCCWWRRCGRTGSSPPFFFFFYCLSAFFAWLIDFEIIWRDPRALVLFFFFLSWFTKPPAVCSGLDGLDPMLFEGWVFDWGGYCCFQTTIVFEEASIRWSPSWIL